MDYKFEDNISADSFNAKSKYILEWIQQNRDVYDWAKDPNAYEMANIFLFGAKYSREGKDIDLNSLTQIWNIRSKDFERCNISENNFVYLICQDSYQSAISGKTIVDDENSHSALRNMARIGLYMKQQQRDSGEINYNNPQELLDLLECSDTLRTKHPALFQKYAFQKNIDVLCRIQLSQELPPEISGSIRGAQYVVTKGRGNFSFEDFPSDSKSYLCSKIIGYSERIVTFLRKYEKEINLKGQSKLKYSSPAKDYYYSLYYELSHARDKVYENISFEDFNELFDSLYKKYDVDFNELSDAIDKIENLEREPNAQDRQELINSLENTALAYFVNKEQKVSSQTDDERD